jgi:PBP1b-binding outer membrane lipoprotein LpoB
MRRILEVTVLTLLLVGCSDRWNPTAPIDNHTSVVRVGNTQSLGGVAGQQISVSASGKSVTASTNFAGEISAVARGCSVSPSFQDAAETPGSSGGMKTATFNLRGFETCGSSTCVVTLTDKKNNSATVQVTATDGSGSGADCV